MQNRTAIKGCQDRIARTGVTVQDC
jgi:hypothetical protein